MDDLFHTRKGSSSHLVTGKKSIIRRAYLLENRIVMPGAGQFHFELQHRKKVAFHLSWKL